MLRKAFTIFIFFACLLYAFQAVKVQAAEFGQVYLRLDSQKASDALGGTACVRPSSADAGTEGKTIIFFPSSFSLNTTLSSWTTDTTESNLPDGATAWPGISTNPTSISGRSVTFSSDNLTSGDDLYCFHFTATGSTTGTSGVNKVGTIQTIAAGGQIIDSSEYGTSIIANNQVSVTAAVSANPTNFLATLTKIEPNSNIISQESNITYRITYGINLTTATDITLEAQWYQGTIDGAASPSVDIVTYVAGSAGHAYDNTAPVIDTVNKKISWTIPSFPAEMTGQTAEFKLRTTTDYTSTSQVTIPVAARLLSGSTSSADSTLTLNYLYAAPSTTTSTTTTTTTATTTPTPTALPSSFYFTDITVNSISQNDSKITVLTNKNSKVSLSYGTSMASLNKRTDDPKLAADHSLTIINLLPDTIYFFKARATDTTGKIISSDFYTFRTARISNPAEILINSLLVTSEKNIITSPTFTTDTLFKKIVIPTSFPFQFRVAIGKSQLVKYARAHLRNKKVLGINSAFNEKNNLSENSSLVEIEPGVFLGQLPTSTTPGEYDLVVTVADYNGNLTETKIASVKVVPRLKIISETTKKGIESARVLLSFLNLRTKTYSVISPQDVPIKNPIYSEPDGDVLLVLPPGTYKAEVNAIGFARKTIEFSIDESQSYPTISLTPQMFNIFVLVEYLKTTIYDLYQAVFAFSTNLSYSYRFFDAMSAFLILSFIALTFLAFSAKTHISIFSLPRYFAHHILKNKKNMYLSGVLRDADNKTAISRAVVSLIDIGTEKILAITSTDRNGLFILPRKINDAYLLSVTKVGYATFGPKSFQATDDLHKNPITLSIDEGIALHPVRSTLHLLEEGLAFTFGVFLAFSFLFEILFVFSFGFVPALPFLILSSFNFILWIFFIHHGRSSN